VEVFTDEKFPEEIEKRLLELEKLASNDELCGIANRRFMKEKIKMLVELYRNYNMNFGLIFIDIDHFKRINDNYSHETGDRVLQMVSNTILNNIRDTDLVGRWGGEEFVAVFTEIEPDIFKKVVERLRLLIEKSFISERDSTQLISVTASIGATVVRDNDTLDSVVERADKLMYASKKNGRNQITFDF
ncbi:MAG: GGDEF domain-containing protein, partial [Thermotogota bacterium]